MINSLLITPSSTILEVTHFENFNVGINNLFAYADDTSVYKLTVKVYSNNIADEGTADIEDIIKLEDQEIFEHLDPIDTS